MCGNYKFNELETEEKIRILQNKTSYWNKYLGLLILLQFHFRFDEITTFRDKINYSILVLHQSLTLSRALEYFYLYYITTESEDILIDYMYQLKILNNVWNYW